MCRSLTPWTPPQRAARHASHRLRAGKRSRFGIRRVASQVKDIDYYREMVGDTSASRFVADGVSSAISAVAQENRAAYVPELTKLFRRK